MYFLRAIDPLNNLTQKQMEKKGCLGMKVLFKCEGAFVITVMLPVENTMM